MKETAGSGLDVSPARDGGRLTEGIIFLGALLLYGLFPSQNANYSEDSLYWALSLTWPSGLINSHHLYLNALREIYRALVGVFGSVVDPARLLAAYSALWGAIGLVALYRLLRTVGCGRSAIQGTMLCAFAVGYWSYAIVGDVYVPATALLVLGTYAFLRTLRADVGSKRYGWLGMAVAAFIGAILHHQAFFVFVIGIALGSFLIREGEWKRRLRLSLAMLAATGLLALAVYGLVYRDFVDHDEQTFASFTSGYAMSFSARPDQKTVSLSTVVNSGGGTLRSMVPYYVVFRNGALARWVQERFPYRNTYPYPYLVRSLSTAEVAIILFGLATAALASAVLFLRGAAAAAAERGPALAILIAMLPQVLFFLWWEAISDEFWIWAIPFAAVLAARGAHTARRWTAWLLNAAVVGLCIGSFMGAISLFLDPGNDIDAVNQGYLSGIDGKDLLIGFDEVQSAARAELAIERQGFRYFNVFDRSMGWSGKDSTDLEAEIAGALSRGGVIFVDPHLTHPPASRMALISLRNPEFERHLRGILARLRSIPPPRMRWQEQVATVPGYFMDL